MNTFKQAWANFKKGLETMINEESEGAKKYNEIGDQFKEMAADEEAHKETLETIEAEKDFDVSNAGPEPKSLLAEQDLEGETKEKAMSDEQILKELQSKGHSLERAKKILAESKQSSNPDYILNYYGLKKSSSRTYRVNYKGKSIQITEMTNGDVQYAVEGKTFTSKEDALSYIDSAVKKSIRPEKKYTIVRNGPTEYVILDENGKQYGNVYRSIKDAQTDIQLAKSGDIITTTQDKLDDTVKAAEDADTINEKEGLVERLRNIQEKRMDATLKMRETEETKKSFKEAWYNSKR